MSLDLQKLRNKLEMLKNPKLRTSKFEKKTWSPEKDKAKVVRMIQDPSQEDPFHELYFHYNMGKVGSILCPRMNSGADCPICSFAFDLRKSGDKNDIAQFKQLMPKQRFYGLVVDREDSTLTPKWWGFGKEIYQQLLEALLSEDWNIFMHPSEGHDAEVTIVQKAGGKTEYSAPKLVFKKKQTKLADDEQKIQAIMNAITPLTEVFKPLTNSEIEEKLNNWLDLKDTDGQEVVRSAEGTSSETEAESGTFKNLDEAFEAALKDE